MNEMKTAAHAMRPTTVFDIRLPNSPLMTNPAAGNRGINQMRSKKFISTLPFHQIDFVDVHRLFVLEHRDHDPEAHRSFGSGHGDDKYGENLACHLLQSI